MASQSAPSQGFEIIIVDDGSRDATENVVRKIATKFQNLRYLKQKQRGPAAARNVGIWESRGEILAFTDDDCIPSEDWIETIQANLTDNEVIGLEGLTYTDHINATPFTHYVENLNGGRAFPTCNIAFRAEVLKRELGFDENFPYPHNEDVELAWRMSKYGKIVFCKEMVVYHPPRREKLSSLVLRQRILSSEFYLFHKWPAKYREMRAINPWVNIYVRYLFFMKPFSSIRWIKEYTKPWNFFFAWTLMMLQIGYLVLLMPEFRRAEKIADASIKKSGKFQIT